MATKTTKSGNRATVMDGKPKKYNVTLYYHTNLTVQVEAESEEAARKAAYTEAEKECHIPELINGLQEDSSPDIEVDEGSELEKIKTDLEINAERYELRGVEFTDEDVESVVNLMNGGVKYEDALNRVIRGVPETLSE